MDVCSNCLSACTAESASIPITYVQREVLLSMWHSVEVKFRWKSMCYVEFLQCNCRPFLVFDEEQWECSQSKDSNKYYSSVFRFKVLRQLSVSIEASGR